MTARTMWVWCSRGWIRNPRCVQGNGRRLGSDPLRDIKFQFETAAK
jgi:hypothetical protein